MANEIALTFKISANAGGTLATNSTYTKTQSMVASPQAVHHTLQTVAAGANAEYPTILSVGSVNTMVANGYWVLLRNQDATNFINIGMVTDNATTSYIMHPVGIALAGEPFGPIRAPVTGAVGSNNYHAIGMWPGVAAAIQVEVLVCTGGTPP